MDYTTVTEIPGNRVTHEALAMLYTRYAYASNLSKGKDVLEVACGAGQGLGHLAKTARKVIGADYTHNLLQMARSHYGDRVPLVCLDAHSLPFCDHTFDVVLFYEAAYYLTSPASFLKECRRLLRPDGVLIMCTVNKEWSDFNPSPYSTKYFTAHELEKVLREQRFRVELYGGFPVETVSLLSKCISAIKRSSVTFGIVPKTMRGKEFLKRIFLGPLVEIPPELMHGEAAYKPPVPISTDKPVPEYKVLYALARPH